MDRGAEDLVWRALASPLRRAILDLLRREPLTTGGIAGRFPELSRYAVMQHLAVLVEAGLVLVERKGRRRFNALNVVPLKSAFERWIPPFQALWAGRLEEIKRRAERAARRQGARK